MDLSSLTNEPGARKVAKRKGRGRASGLGKTAGRGSKGQFARKGHKRKLDFEGGQMPLIRRLPKRGFKNPARVEFFAVNVETLAKCFKAGDVVTSAELFKAGLANDKFPVKVLAKGDISIALTVKANAFSAAAKEKIEKAGGTCEIVK